MKIGNTDYGIRFWFVIVFIMTYSFGITWLALFKFFLIILYIPFLLITLVLIGWAADNDLLEEKVE